MNHITTDGTSRNGIKLHQETFRLDIRKKFSLALIKHCNRLPRELVESPSLKEFKTHVDMVHRDRFSDGLGSTGLMVGPNNLEIFSSLNYSVILKKGRIQLDCLHLLLKDDAYISKLQSAVNFWFTLGMGQQPLFIFKTFNMEFIEGSAL